VPFGVYSADETHVGEVYGRSLLLPPELHIFWRGDTLPDDPTALAAAATGHGDGAYGAPATSPLDPTDETRIDG
jgi:hypothetical protein